jgi:DNA-binding transcriptional MerR regulator
MRKVEQIALPQMQAARAIGVTDRTLRRWEREGLIAGRRVRRGGVKLYAVEQLRALAGSEAVRG